MLLTVIWVIVAAATHFDARMAFDFPPTAFRIDHRIALGLGMALTIAMYDFFGYYQVCYLADEVADASRTIPRSILISVLAVGLMYLAMNVAILGVIPWPAVVASHHIASDLMQRLYGPWAARRGHADDRLDGPRVGVRGDAGLQPDSLCVGQGRAISSRHSPRFIPTGKFPHRSLAIDRRPGGDRVPGRAEDGHRCPGGIANSRSSSSARS